MDDSHRAIDQNEECILNTHNAIIMVSVFLCIFTCVVGVFIVSSGENKTNLRVSGL